MKATRKTLDKGSLALAIVTGLAVVNPSISQVATDLSSLDGSNGFAINGIDDFDRSGVSVSAVGDINGDGIGDIIIGAYLADQGGMIRVGESYVVFGKDTGFSASMNLTALDGSDGFVINGIDGDDRSGYSVSGAGDMNGDDIDDLLIGAWTGDPGNRANAGESYVVFGSNLGFLPSLDLSALDGSNGFVINGIDPSDISGKSVSAAGDINGDGVGDIIIGAQWADPGGRHSAGESYVVFGNSQGFSAVLELSMLDGNNGFVINGDQENDFSGKAVSAAGDFNGDGIDDLIIGASGADFGVAMEVGQSYVVFGKTTPFSASLNLSSLNGNNGLVINGIAAGDNAGISVSGVGDVNGDGVDDVIIGADYASPGLAQNSGASYVLFGSQQPIAASIDLSTLNGSNGFAIFGAATNDYSGHSVSAAGDINGDGVDDVIIGAAGAAGAAVGAMAAAGKSYLIFGKTLAFASSLDLGSLSADDGIAINGAGADDASGRSVSNAGDLNGDGMDDLVIGARYADPPGTDSAGASYVIFGSDFVFANDFEVQ